MAFSDGKKIVHNKHMKKIGIITASAAVAAIAVVTLFALVKRGGNGDFTIKFDSTNTVNHTVMTPSLDGDPAQLLIGQPIKNVKLTTAKLVEEYLKGLVDSKEMGGSQNMADAEEGYDDAIVYTIYLSNTSSTENQTLYYELVLDNIVNPSNEAVSPLLYMRNVVQTSVVEKNSVTEKDLTTDYFAHAHSSMKEKDWGTIEGADDMRECISSYSKVMGEDGKTVRQPTYIGESKDGFCHNFLDSDNTKNLISESIELAPNEVKRFTFVTYFEGEDPDSFGSVTPDVSTILMSLHFGVK